MAFLGNAVTGIVLSPGGRYHLSSPTFVPLLIAKLAVFHASGHFPRWLAPMANPGCQVIHFNTSAKIEKRNCYDFSMAGYPAKWSGLTCYLKKKFFNSGAHYSTWDMLGDLVAHWTSTFRWLAEYWRCATHKQVSTYCCRVKWNLKRQ